MQIHIAYKIVLIINASTVNDACFLFPWCIKTTIFCCSVENLLILAFILSPKNSDTTCVFYWYIFHSDLDETPNTHDFFIQTSTTGLVTYFCNTLSEEYRFYHTYVIEFLIIERELWDVNNSLIFCKLYFDYYFETSYIWVDILKFKKRLPS